MSGVRTGAGDSFCLAGSSPGDPLSVLRVGYAPYRMVLTPALSLAIALEPIGTLGSRSSLALGGRPANKLGAPPALTLSDAAPAPDVFALESATVRAAMAAFVAAVPRSLPERATVLRWQAELKNP